MRLSAGRSILRIAALLSIVLLVVSAPCGAQTKAYPQQFVGIWKAQRDGKTWLVLNLHEEAVRLAGTMQKTIGGPDDNALGDPVKVENSQLEREYLLFDLVQAGGKTSHWRMEVTSPGIATLRPLDSTGSDNDAIQIARETIYGLAKPPAPGTVQPLPADLRQFAGEWQTAYQGHAFIKLVLREESGKLTGSCQHSRSINWDRRGELTIVSQELSQDDILNTAASGTTLSVVIGNADDPDDPVKLALTLTGEDEAQGVLTDLPPDVPKQKPWMFRRVAK